MNEICRQWKLLRLARQVRNFSIYRLSIWLVMSFKYLSLQWQRVIIWTSKQQNTWVIWLCSRNTFVPKSNWIKGIQIDHNTIKLHSGFIILNRKVIWSMKVTYILEWVWKHNRLKASFISSLHFLLGKEDMAINSRIVLAELELLKKSLGTLPLDIEESSSSCWN